MPPKTWDYTKIIENREFVRSPLPLQMAAFEKYVGQRDIDPNMTEDHKLWHANKNRIEKGNAALPNVPIKVREMEDGEHGYVYGDDLRLATDGTLRLDHNTFIMTKAPKDNGMKVMRITCIKTSNGKTVPTRYEVIGVRYKTQKIAWKWAITPDRLIPARMQTRAIFIG